MAQQALQVTAPSGVEAQRHQRDRRDERKGRPSDLFWPWFGANVSVLGLSYGVLRPRLRAVVLAGDRSPA